MDIVKFWLVKNKSSLEQQLQNNEITDNCIVFIEETHEIWTKGQIYGVDPNYLKTLENKIVNIQNMTDYQIDDALSWIEFP